MAKKKRGNKKNKSGGRGGGDKPSASSSGGASKQQSPHPEEEQQPLKAIVDGEKDVVVDERLVLDEAESTPAKDSEEALEISSDASSQGNSVGSNIIGDIKVEPPVRERVKAIERVLSVESIGGSTPAEEADAADANNDDAKETEDIIVKPPSSKVDGAIEPDETKDVTLNDCSDSANDSPTIDAEKEPVDTCSVGGGDAKDQPTDGKDESAEAKSEEDGSMQVDNDVSSQIKIDSVPTPGIEKDASINGNRVLEELGSFSDVDDNIPHVDDNTPRVKKSFDSFPSQLSQEMEEVDLDAASQDNSSINFQGAPLVRAYNGTPNGISPSTNNSLSFTFKDANESEAFVFLTASLRETLGEDANGVTDETLSRYIRWKPDVSRAAERFRAYQTFRKENSYIFDDKPLLLSQDPKLTFLLQNGFVIGPEELVAKDGSAVMIIRGAKCDVSAHCDDQDASRAIFYILQRMMKRNTFDPLKGVTIVLDLAGATRKNIPKTLASLISKQAGCFPLRVRAIHVVAMPWWFPAGNKKLFTIKMRSRIHFLKGKAALGEYIEKDRLLEEDGGIYNFDIQSWISSTFLQEVEC